MKRKSTFLQWFLLLAVIVLGSGKMNGQVEELIYSTGFESAEGFTAGTVYNNTTVAFTGPAGQRWGTYYGTPSTTSPIVGSQSMQLRWYTTAVSNLGYTYTDFNLPNASKVVFKAANTIITNGLNVIVSYSTDGGTNYVNPETFTLSATTTEFTYNISATGAFANVRLKFQASYSAAPTNTVRLYLDDVKVYGITSSNPTVATPTFSPSTGNYTSPQSVTISTTTEGASIYYTTNGVDPTEASTLVSGPVNVSTTTTLKARAYKSGMDASAVASATYTFPVEVANIAALRSQATGSAVYKLTGEAVLTLKTTARNAKYIQDATAGILIDDAGGVISTSYNVGDGITGITGTLGTYSGMLQFTPIADPGAATSTGNVVTPLAVSLNDLPNYPGQLVKVSGVTISDVEGGDGTFGSAKNFPLNSNSERLIRTAYADLPWIGQPIPSGQQDVTGVVLIFNTTAQLVPRTISDFSGTPVAVPTITVSVIDIPAMSAEINQTDVETFTVSAQNLTENITLELSGTNANLFSLSTYSITPTSGSVSNVEVTVTYAPLVAGSHSATITLSSAGATNVTRNLTATATNPAVPMPNVIITEVYGGGGNTGATLKNDFIELYNTTEESINLGGWSLQYYSATGTGTATVANTYVFPASKFIPGKTHLLVQAAAGTGGTEDLPAPDAISTIALGATGGKVILYTSNQLQTITSSISSITENEFFKDYIAYGTTAVPVWGSATSAVSNTTSASRKKVEGSFVYTQNIGNDFEVVTPNPQNTGILSSVDETRLLPVMVVGSQIRFNANAGERVEVYNAMGQQLYAAPATDGMNAVTLNARGLMIVKVGELVTKVIM